MDGADKVADFTWKKAGFYTMNNMEVCALCPAHMEDYQKHVDSCTCAVSECGLFGADHPTRNGSNRLCVDHAQKLILSDSHADRSKSPPMTRGWSTKWYVKPMKKEDDNLDSDTPPLEPIPPKVEAGRRRNPSESVSTGGTNSLFDGRLGEI